MITLDVQGLESGYGEVQILWGLSIQLEQGRLTSLVGSNGSGKTTLLRTITGLLPAWKASPNLDGKDATKPPAHQKAHTVEEVMASPVVAYPLTRLMSCSARVDGAGAIIVCAKEAVAKYSTRKPLVNVAACVQRSVPFYDFGKPETVPITYAHDPSSVMQAYEIAGVGPKDMEIAQCHDAFSIEELISYQALGFCPPGEGGRMIDEGRTTLKGDIPYNTDGGLVARGNPVGATGAAQICETVTQIRGEAGARQVPGRDGKGPKIGLIHNAGGGPVEDAIASLMGIILKR